MPWVDRKLVTFISTCLHGAVTTINRRQGAAVVALNAPKFVETYNDHMGGVDLSDRIRLVYGMERRGVIKPWHKMFRGNRYRRLSLRQPVLRQ